MESKQATAARPPRAGSVEVDVEEAEAALVEHYPHLVRLAYLTLPPSLGRHRRVITAHALVQRALPRSPVVAASAYALVRQEVLRAALRSGLRRRGRPGLPLGLPLGLRSGLGPVMAAPPYVWGLRLHPKAGGTDESALDRALTPLDAAGRAAYVLRESEGLDRARICGLLERLGAADARTAVKAAEALPEGLLRGREFDPATVGARPTDLLRRRQHVKAGLIVAGAVAVAGALLGILGGTLGGAAEPYAAAGAPSGTYAGAYRDPGKLVRARSGAWRHTARTDFTAWPARGGRTKDTALLGRALAVWANPGPAVRVSATVGTARSRPAQEPQLLYAGEVDGAVVVVLYDGMRVVRYAEPGSRAGGGGGGGAGAAALDFARVDGAGATTAAVVVGRTDGNTRFLTAPWVSRARTRDLLAPGRAAVSLHRTADGVTDPVRIPGADTGAGSCGTTWPVLEFANAARTGGRPYLLTDLGELVPAQLTYQRSGAAGPTARASWAHTVCNLPALRGHGVRTVDAWEYSHQLLPERNGTASWVCLRSDTWRGAGRALALFLPPTASATSPGAPVGQSGSDTAACGGHLPQVLAGVLWKSTAGNWYLLAAGSPDVARIEASGGVTATGTGSTLAAPAERGARAELTGVLDSGDSLTTLR